MKAFKRFFGYLRGYEGQVLLSIALILAVSALVLPYPIILRYLIDEALPRKDWNQVKQLVLLFLVFFLARGVLSYLNRYVLQRTGMRITVDLRKEMFAHLQRMSLKYYETNQTGQLVARIAEDSGTLHSLITNVLVNLVSDAVTLIAVFFMLFSINPRLALVTMAVLPFFVLNYVLSSKRLKSLSKRHRRNWHRAVGFLHERIASARLVKSFSMEEMEIGRFNRSMDQDFQNYNNLTLYNTRLWVAADMISSLGGLLVLFYGGWMTLQGVMSIGQLVEFNTFIGFIYSPIVRLSDMNAIIDRSIIGLEKIYSIMDTPSAVADAPDALNLPPLQGRIEFKNVDFSYNAGREILKNINLTVEPGKMVALVGPSGSGKSTIINLLNRFYDVDNGSIRVDGFDIRNVRIKSLRRQIGVVMQENLLLSGELINNIKYGYPEASYEQVVEAAKAAHAHEFITKMPRGYHTAVGERGVKLSGGQRQRIAIARALLTDPRILIFDEATSALDTESERLIQEAMESFTRNRTVLVIAHRLSTILKADEILVLKDGSIVEQGSHHQLLKKNGVYRRLYDLQFQETA
jgi:subfamily B ATP-binding cassette protein MsbA